jgi:hypothetical protein
MNHHGFARNCTALFTKRVIIDSISGVISTRTLEGRYVKLGVNAAPSRPGIGIQKGFDIHRKPFIELALVGGDRHTFRATGFGSVGRR